MAQRTPAIVIVLLIVLALVVGGLGTIALLSGSAAAGPREDLAKLCDGYWQGHLRMHPVAATSIGDKRYDDRLEDISPAGKAQETKRLEGVLARARAIDENPLDSARRLDHRALIEEVEGRLDEMSCEFEQWSVDPTNGPQNELINLADYTVIETPQDGDRFVARCRAMGRYLDDHIANLTVGL